MDLAITDSGMAFLSKIEQIRALGESKEYRIRIETTEEAEIKNIIDKLEPLFVVSKVKTYPRRNGGYHHYLTITGYFDYDSKEVQ